MAYITYDSVHTLGHRWHTVDMTQTIVVPVNIASLPASERVVAIKSVNVCDDCGWSPVAHAKATGKDIRHVVRAMDFAHIDRDTKYRTSSGKVVHPNKLFTRGYALDTILNELVGCRTLCKVCHAIETAEGV